MKHELDSLDIRQQQFKVALITFGLELKMRKDAEEPFVSIEASHTHEDNEVNFDLPPKFDEYEEQEEMEESIMEEQQEEEVVYAKEDDMFELKPLLSTQKCTFSPYCETPTTFVPLPPHQIATFHSIEPIKEGSFFLSLIEPTPKPYFENANLENLRTNSFLEGENDVNMGTVLEQGMSNPSNQKSKALNQASKGLTWLPMAPQTVVKTMVAPGLLFVFDPGKGQL